MKIGLAISAVIVVLISLFLYVRLQGSPDQPTHATRGPGKLDKGVLPDDLPVVFEPTEASKDATELYYRAFELYQDKVTILRRKNPAPEFADPIVDLMIEAMRAGKVKEGFLDEKVSLKPGIHREFADLAVGVGSMMRNRAAEIYADDPQRALDATLSIFALGQRTFEHNVLFEHRNAGIANMTGVVRDLQFWAQDNPDMFSKHYEATDAWAEALNRFAVAWNTKSEILRPLQPNIGDVMQVAKYDKDPTFRIVAIQKLGMLQFNPGTPANETEIKRILTEAKKDEHPLIAGAAAAALEFTLDEFKRMKI